MTKSYLAKGFARLALAATVASGGVLAVSAPASAATEVATEVWVRISVYNSGLVAAMPSPYTTNNAQVVTATYGDMAYNGQWELHEVATGGYTIENRFSHQCLDTENGGSQAVGTPVVQMSCNKSSSQRWVLTHDATLPVWHISNYSSGLYLKVDNGSTVEGAGFIQANNLPNNTSEMIQIW